MVEATGGAVQTLKCLHDTNCVFIVLMQQLHCERACVLAGDILITILYLGEVTHLLYNEHLSICQYQDDALLWRQSFLSCLSQTWSLFVRSCSWVLEMQYSVLSKY